MWVWVAVVPALLWSLASVALAGGGPSPARVLAAAVALAMLLVDRRPRAAVPLLALGVAVFLAQRPAADRAWVVEQSRLPSVEWESADRFTLRDQRAFRWRSVDEAEPRWVDSRWSLAALSGVEMGVEPLSALEALAHTFVVFRFDDGRALVASVEIRREVGERFSPVRGLFRNYERMVVLGDPEDLVGLRVEHRRHAVVLHPLVIPLDRARAFLRVILDDVDRLSRRPEWYHTVAASCSSTLAGHIRAVAPLPYDLRTFLPGYADALAHELGWLGPGELDALRAAHRQVPPG